MHIDLAHQLLPSSSVQALRFMNHHFARDVIPVNSLSNKIPLRGPSSHLIAAARARCRQGVARRPHPKVRPRSPHLPVRRHRRWGRGRAAGGRGSTRGAPGWETVSESPVATEAPLTSKVTISGWSTKRLKGRRNIFLNQPTDLTLGEGQQGEDRATLRRHCHAPGRR
jgi:hypothetical protein